MHTEPHAFQAHTTEQINRHKAGRSVPPLFDDGAAPPDWSANANRSALLGRAAPPKVVAVAPRRRRHRQVVYRRAIAAFFWRGVGCTALIALVAIVAIVSFFAGVLAAADEAAVGMRESQAVRPAPIKPMT